MQSRGVRRPSVCPSVCKLFCANRFFYHKHDWIATKLAHDGPQQSPHPGCAQGQGQRSRYTGTSVMSRNVCCTVRSDVLSLHALTLWNTIILSLQYKYQAAVYILEWATPSLTVWCYLFNTVLHLRGSFHCLVLDRWWRGWWGNAPPEFLG